MEIDSCQGQGLIKALSTCGSFSDEISEGMSASIHECSLPRTHILGEHIFSFIGEIVLGVVYVRGRHIG